MLHILPQSHKELLQKILMELIQAREPDATFEEKPLLPEPDPVEKEIGK